MRGNINVVTYSSSMFLITTNCTKLRNGKVFTNNCCWIDYYTQSMTNVKPTSNLS